MDPQQHWYRKNISLKGQVIADVGANVGRLSQFFWEHAGRKSQLVSIEPHPANIKAIQKRIRKAGSSKWSLKKCAVSSRDGHLELRTLKSDIGDNAMVVQGDGNIKVPCQRLQRLVPDATVVKLDIEGHEYEVLPDAVPALDKVHCWAVELHRVEGYPLEDTLRLFVDHGFSLVGAGQKAGQPEGPWLDVPVTPALSWAQIPAAKRSQDGLPSVFKMLHVIARR